MNCGISEGFNPPGGLVDASRHHGSMHALVSCENAVLIPNNIKIEITYLIKLSSRTLIKK
jgi:hypothetical protein